MSSMERIRQVLDSAEARKKIGSVKKSLKGISWFAVGVAFIFVLGVIFFVVGIVNLTSHGDSSGERDSNSQTSGWILFSIGLVLIILGFSAFMGKCFCPRPPQRPPRTHVHRHRGRRVSAPNERPAPRSQRIWSVSPPLDASTPTAMEPRTPTGDVSMRPGALGERRLSNAPPAYDEAMGRLRQSAINSLDPNPPPYNPELESIQISLP